MIRTPTLVLILQLVFHPFTKFTGTVAHMQNKQSWDVLPNINHTQAAERAEDVVFCAWWPWPLSLTFKLFRTKDRTRRLPCEFDTNPFRRSRNILYTNKKVTESAKNITLCSSLRVVTRRHWVERIVVASGMCANPNSNPDHNHNNKYNLPKFDQFFSDP